MKKTLILFSLAIATTLSMVSCKNGNKSQNHRPTQEEIQMQKQALADSVLAQIDEYAQRYWDSYSKSFSFRTMELTEAEKAVKPDYLLDPSVANELVTRSQKINALAFYISDVAVLALYDLPLEDTKNAIAKLAAETNFPMDMDYVTSGSPISEKIKKTYEACKNSGDLALFWQFEYSIVSEISYILSNNPDLFLRNITEEQWQAFNVAKEQRRNAINELAKYDEEMAQLVDLRIKNSVTASDEIKQKYQSIQTAKDCYKSHKAIYAAKREAFLQ